MKRVALTGGIATGKSHVRAVFDALGVPTIDADLLSHDTVAPGTPGFAAVTARFGPSVLDIRGDIDRRRLGEIVFADAAARRDLEAIIHPAVVTAIDTTGAAMNSQIQPNWVRITIDGMSSAGWTPSLPSRRRPPTMPEPIQRAAR